MRFPTNLVSDLLKVFRASLNGIYDNRETDNFFFLAMEKYIGLTKTQILAQRELKVSESVINSTEALINSLKNNIPIQYILGETNFYGLKLITDSRALIPRPETEELVHLLINDFKNTKKIISVLDIGTGSGCIAIAVKKNISDAEVFAIDNSESALSLARENALKNEVQINFVLMDICVSENRNSLPLHDVIISNPPYVRESEKKFMQPNVLDYEPHNALFVTDKDPLIFYRQILHLSEEKLKPGGTIYFEINEYLADELLNQVTKFSLQAKIRNDIYGKPRFCIIKKPE